jgi:hypothetical protein
MYNGVKAMIDSDKSMRPIAKVVAPVVEVKKEAKPLV